MAVDDPYLAHHVVRETRPPDRMHQHDPHLAGAAVPREAVGAARAPELRAAAGLEDTFAEQRRRDRVGGVGGDRTTGVGDLYGTAPATPRATKQAPRSAHRSLLAPSGGR